MPEHLSSVLILSCCFSVIPRMSTAQAVQNQIFNYVFLTFGAFWVQGGSGRFMVFLILEKTGAPENSRKIKFDEVPRRSSAQAP